MVRVTVDGPIDGRIVLADRIFTGVLRDLTEKKENEKQLRDNHAKLSAFLETAVDSIISIDEVGTILSFNPAAERMLGYSSQEIIGRNVRSLMPSPFQEEHDGYLSNYLDTGLAKIIGTGREVVVLRKDGTQFPADLAISEIRHDGDRIFTGVLRDLTEKKRWESQFQHSQKLESLGVLAGGIAHDFNNLLMGVLGHSSLVITELSPESPIQSSMKDIQDTATGAAELCKQMLAYSGKGRFVVQALSLSEVVKQFGHLLEISVPKNVVLKYELAGSLPAINADSRQMQQLVMNLITNATEAIGTDSGIVTLATGVMNADEEYLKSTYLDDKLPSGDYVYYEVSDSGCGMTDDTKQKLFDPFFTTKFTGRGLGLAALLGIVRGHQGAVKIYSEVGKGTTFKVLFPAIDIEAVSVPAGVTPPRKWKGKGKLLIVDDDETARTVSKRILESGGFTTLLACDGREGIKIFEKHQCEIIGVLLDMTMPHMDGLATFLRLKQLEPGVQVILTSGYSKQDATSRFSGKGLAGFIQKPYRPVELLHLMDQILGRTPSE